MSNEGGGMRVGGCGMWKYRLVYEIESRKRVQIVLLQDQ
jgi:hypothetical protein